MLQGKYGYQCLVCWHLAFIWIPSGNRQKAYIYASKLNSPVEHCRTPEVHHLYCLIVERLMAHFWPMRSNIFLNSFPGVSTAHCPLSTGSLDAATPSFREQKHLIIGHLCQRRDVSKFLVLEVFLVGFSVCNAWYEPLRDCFWREKDSVQNIIQFRCVLVLLNLQMALQNKFHVLNFSNSLCLWNSLQWWELMKKRPMSHVSSKGKGWKFQINRDCLRKTQFHKSCPTCHAASKDGQLKTTVWISLLCWVVWLLHMQQSL